MDIRKSNKNDLDGIMAVIQDAKASLKKDGVPQWQGVYPGVEEFEEDIEMDGSYVVEVDGKIVGTAFLKDMEESTYATIDGAWMVDGRYVVIHRFAILSSMYGSGVSRFVVEQAIEIARSCGCESVRVDTHPENLRMQAFVKRMGFVYCGVISCEYGGKRLAYELKV